VPNDFETFYTEHSEIRAVFFNGTAAAKFYKKYVGFNENLKFYVLPSTSPANASMRFEEKLKKWENY